MPSDSRGAFESDECIQPFWCATEGLECARNQFVRDILERMEAESHPVVPMMAAAARENRIV
jgi:hypothetical protein